VIGRFNDFVAGEIQHAAIKRLESDADLLLGDGGGHGGKTYLGPLQRAMKPAGAGGW
jgi:hypothetical protein